MALSTCTTATNAQGMETIQHGSFAFPIACYEDDLSKLTVPWHWHDELEAAIVIEGTLSLYIGDSNQHLEISAGNGFFINSTILHSTRQISSERCVVHSFVFHPRLIGGNVESVFWQKYLLPLMNNERMCFHPLGQNSPWQAQLLLLIQSVWQALVEEKPGYEFTIRRDLSSLLYELQAHCPTTTQLPSQKELRQSQRIKQMLEFIHTHYFEEITTREIADSIALSPSECLRCFHNTIGTTPIQYLMDYRIQKASEQLEQTDRTISEIASACGFHEMSYFTKCFKKIKGHTPSQYRKMCGCSL